MEALNPYPSPLRCPEAGGLVSPLLLGEWQLVYASNGTVVTRTAAAQLLLQAAQLPGVGLDDITQVWLGGAGWGPAARAARVPPAYFHAGSAFVASAGHRGVAIAAGLVGLSLVACTTD